MRTLALLLGSILSGGLVAQVTYEGTSMASLGDTVYLAEDTLTQHF